MSHGNRTDFSVLFEPVTTGSNKTENDAVVFHWDMYRVKRDISGIALKCDAIHSPIEKSVYATANIAWSVVK